MNTITLINVSLSVSALLVVLFSMARSVRQHNCDLMVGDVLVILTYLLTVNTEWIYGQPGMDSFDSERAWEVFGLVVMVNLLAHTIVAVRKHKRDS